jgi:hypothetical protein
MAKKRKKKPTSYMMVIRVRVPAKQVPKMKVWRVIGLPAGARVCHDLQVLNAYYDMPGVPSAIEE